MMLTDERGYMSDRDAATAVSRTDAHAEAAQAFCDASETFVQRLDDAIRTRLDRQDAPVTLRALTAEVVPAVAPTVEATMVSGLSVQAHLDALARRGLARWTMAGRERAWSPT